jgi:FG-GAP-like repeat/FG-GAP repeat
MPTRLVVVLVAAALQSSCLLLPGYQETGCGDSILGVEEDCDGRHDPAGGTCGEPASAQACHYVCGGEDAVACPVGWGCGLDGRCYQPGGDFEDPDSTTLLPIRVSAVSDIDGDGYADLLGNSDTTLSVRFSDGEGKFGDDFLMSIPRPTGPVWFAPLDSDSLTDVLIPLGPTLLAFAGQSGRELDSFLFPSVTFPASLDVAVGTVVEAERPGLIADSEMLIIRDDAEAGILGQMGFLDTLCPNLPTDVIPLPDGHGAFELAAGPFGLTERAIPTADIDGNGMTEFALAFPGAQVVYLYTSDGALNCPSPAPYEAMPQIALPPGTTLHSMNPLFADLDGDDDLDLLLPLLDDVFRVRVAAARSLGNGTFEPASILPELDDLGVDFDEQRVPLAAADLDGNKRADYVTPAGIYLAFPPTDGGTLDQLVPVAAARQTAWLDAEIVDVNGDGALDVIATSPERGIDWLVNAGPVGPFVRFNRFLVDTAFRPTHLRSGDFNGDQLTDVIVLEELSFELYELTVVFSTPSGVPGEGLRSGRVRQPVWLMEPSQIPDLNPPELDGVTDIFLVNDLGNGLSGVYGLQGSTSQQLISPFVAFPLLQGPTSDNQVIVAAAVGDFLGDAAAAPEARRRFIAAVAVPEAAFRSGQGNEVDEVDAPSSLVLLQSSPVGELSQLSLPVELGLLSAFNARCAVWLSGDLDAAGEAADEGSPRDELIAVESLRSCPLGSFERRLTVQILRFPPGGGPGPMAPVSTIVQLPPDYADVVSARLEDLDADGRRDLLVFGQSVDFEWLVTILWSDDGCRADPSVCLAQSTRLALPEETFPGGGAPELPPIGGDQNDYFRPVVDVAPVQLAGDGRREIAVLYNGLNANLYVYEASAAAPREFAMNPRARDIPMDFTFATGMSAGDVNGDGLDDLVVGFGPLTNVFWQAPAPALGAEPEERMSFPTEGAR